MALQPHCHSVNMRFPGTAETPCRTFTLHTPSRDLPQKETRYGWLHDQDPCLILPRYPTLDNCSPLQTFENEPTILVVRVL